MTNARIIRNWIKQFSDQKLAEVYAFNQDGKMCFVNFHSCLLGVTYCDQLHITCEDFGHCSAVLQADRTLEGSEAQKAYLHLGTHGFIPAFFLGNDDDCRRWRLSRILRAEMRERDRVRADRRRKCAVEQVAPLHPPETEQQKEQERQYDHSLL